MCDHHVQLHANNEPLPTTLSPAHRSRRLKSKRDRVVSGSLLTRCSTSDMRLNPIHPYPIFLYLISSNPTDDPKVYAPILPPFYDEGRNLLMNESWVQMRM